MSPLCQDRRTPVHILNPDVVSFPGNHFRRWHSWDQMVKVSSPPSLWALPSWQQAGQRMLKSGRRGGAGAGLGSDQRNERLHHICHERSVISL